MAVVEIMAFTDPACPWSWGAEPSVAHLDALFGDQVAITYVMGGLAREFSRPADVLAELLDAAAASAMPVDPRLWLDHPPSSSYPVCLAVKAAAEQGRDAAYLRRAREGLMCERRRLDGTDGLVELARSVPGLDVARFAIDLASNAIVERFGADLDRVRELHPEHHGDAGRVPFPSFDVAGAYVEADGLVAAVGAAGAVERERPGVEELLRGGGRLATVEVAAACDLPGPRAAAELWRLATEWRVRPERYLTGELWSAA